MTDVGANLKFARVVEFLGVALVDLLLSLFSLPHIGHLVEQLIWSPVPVGPVLLDIVLVSATYLSAAWLLVATWRRMPSRSRVLAWLMAICCLVASFLLGVFSCDGWRWEERMATEGWLYGTAVTIIAALVLWDARRRGYRYGSDGPRATNLGAAGWAVGVWIMPIVFLPAYIVRILRNGSFNEAVLGTRDE